MSILSTREDGFGFFYTLEPNGYRQINVRRERTPFDRFAWAAYVGGEVIGHYPTKDEAEAGAISWAKANPEKGDEG
jgi:hypothetical protein